jgi:3-oxoacyl-[acyl-carrier-protein] synthase II
VLAEGAAAVVLAADEVVAAHGLQGPCAEVAGVGWTSDAHHFTRPFQPTIVRAMRDALADAEIDAAAIGSVNAHGTSTPTGDAVEVAVPARDFRRPLPRVPVSANKSQVGHSLGAAAAVEAVLRAHGARTPDRAADPQLRPDPELAGPDFVAKAGPRHEFVLSNSFGFGGTNCCVIFRGV